MQYLERAKLGLVKLNVNGRDVEIGDDYADGSLLWALRDGAGLCGTKFGCGVGICGSCTVHVDGRPARSCLVPVAAVADAEITTIEALAGENGELHEVLRAFIEEQVPQCAWCMNGQIMTAVAFLRATPDPDEDEIAAALDANYCRCGCYARIRRAVARAAKALRGRSDD